MTIRGRAALAAGAAARWASRVTGRGAGAMIGGLVAKVGYKIHRAWHWLTAHL